jgi:iron(III) transport system substrate-binding protein
MVQVVRSHARAAGGRPSVAALLAAALSTVLSAVMVASCAAGTKPVAAANSAAPNSAASNSAAPTSATSITLYTSVTQTTIDAVVAAFHTTHPTTKVSVFRAPTGALNARIATDQRSGGLQADVLWVSDPLTMHGYDSQGLLEKYTAPSAMAIPAQYRTPSFAGAGLLYLVLIYHQGLAPVPTNWSDLTASAYRGRVALPDPGFAGSAMGALGYFAEQQHFGLDFYRRLKANGAVQVQSPEDVVTGVAQGRYKVGMTIADSGLAAAKKGSPVGVGWPAGGAIAIYSPIGVSAASKHRGVAESFEDFVLSEPGQRAIAKSGRQPSLPGLSGIAKPADATVVSPDWPAFFADKDSVLAAYKKIFGS